VTTKDPFYKGPQEPRRHRELKEAPFTNRPQDDSSKPGPEEVTEGRLVDLFDGFAFQINRATALLSEVEPRAQKLQVPVDVDAVKVREALRRRQHDENFISFGLYKDLIDEKIKISRRMDFQIATELTGDTLTDGYKITKYLRTGGKGLSPWEEFLMNMESFAIWLLLNQLLGNFDAADKGATCAAKEPPGTETPVVALQRAGAYAAMLLIMGLQEDHIIFAVNKHNPNLGIPNTDFLNRARKLAESDDFSRVVNQMVGADDQETILRYADNYIGRNAVDYEMWLAYRDLLNMREDAKTMYIYSHQYSQEYSVMLDYSFEHQHTTPAQSSSGFPFLFTGQRQARVVNVGEGDFIPPATIHFSQYTAMSNHLGAVDRGISAVAGVLTSGYAYDLLCCIARFMDAQSLEDLKKIAAVLEIAYTTLTGGINFYLADPTTILDWAVSGIQQALLEFVNRFFQDFIDDVMGFINRTPGTTWDLLFACPLIEDMITYILQVIARFQAKVNQLIQQYLGRTFSFYNSGYQRWGLVWDAKRLRTILAIINSLIDQIVRCGPLDDLTPPEDGEPPAGPGEDPQLYEAVPRPLVLPPAMIEKFFSSPHNILREEGQRPIPAVGTIASSTDDVTTANFRDICRGILPDELLRAVGATTDE